MDTHDWSHAMYQTGAAPRSGIIEGATWPTPVAKDWFQHLQVEHCTLNNAVAHCLRAWDNEVDKARRGDPAVAQVLGCSVLIVMTKEKREGDEEERERGGEAQLSFPLTCWLSGQDGVRRRHCRPLNYPLLYSCFRGFWALCSSDCNGKLRTG